MLLLHVGDQVAGVGGLQPGGRLWARGGPGAALVGRPAGSSDGVAAAVCRRRGRRFDHVWMRVASAVGL
jgi:hypothetical protein